MQRRLAGLARWMFAAAAAALGAGLLAPAPPAGAAPGSTTTITRIAGADQYATAAAIATSSFTTAATAVVATTAAPYDAGVANYLAGALHAPILLTSVGALPSATSAALASLHVTHVVVLGGTLAVSAEVVGTLERDGYLVTRLGGADRYATAALAAGEVGPEAVGTTGGQEKTAIIASGISPGDFEAIGPMAFAGPFPVLYADGNGLPQATRDALTSLGIDHVVIVGGPLAVPAGVEGALSSLGITSERIAGANALETAARLANFEISHLGFATSHVDIARGDDLADALAGGPHAGLVPAPVLPTASPTELGGATAIWLAHQCPSITSAHVFGGPLAVSDAVLAQVKTLLTSCGNVATNLATSIATGGSTGGGTTGGGSTGGGSTGGGSTGGGGGVSGPATDLVLASSVAYPSSGTSVTMTATVTANGTPVPGARVDFFVVDASTEGSHPVSGVCTLSDAASPNSTGTSCTIDGADPVTNAAGQATFVFHWASPVGKRPIEGSWPQTVYAFTGADGTPFSPSTTGLVWDDTTVTWVNAVTAVALDPAVSTVAYGGTATIRATIESVNDEKVLTPVPRPGASIAWAAYRGATCTLGAPTPPAGIPVTSGSVLTDSAGTATITYTYSGTPPATDTTDCLFAFYDESGDQVLQSGAAATTGTVTWSSASSASASLVVTPSGASRLVGTAQDLAATVRDQYGVPVPGVNISWTISRAAAEATTPPPSGTAITGTDGSVTISDPSPTGSALDTITATAGTLEGTATLYWVETAASGTYTNVTVLNAETSSTTSGTIDVNSGGTYLRLSYDPNDVLKVGDRTVQTERFSESLTSGATLSASPYSADQAGVSTFTVASSMGGGGGGGGSHGGGGSGTGGSGTGG